MGSSAQNREAHNKLKLISEKLQINYLMLK